MVNCSWWIMFYVFLEEHYIYYTRAIVLQLGFKAIEITITLVYYVQYLLCPFVLTFAFWKWHTLYTIL